jgi:hypothetical protein
MVDDQQRLFRLALERMGLVRPGESLTLESLAGGVSSDIFRAVWPQGSACVKRALPKLKVKADWQAPVERNRSVGSGLCLKQEQLWNNPRLLLFLRIKVSSKKLDT